MKASREVRHLWANRGASVSSENLCGSGGLRRQHHEQAQHQEELHPTLGAIGCSKGATAPDHVRNLMLGGEVTIRSRTYAMDWVDIYLDDRLVGAMGQ
jgi:hypothetical protein